MNDKKVIRSNQHGFTKGESCLSNLIAICHEGREVVIVYLDFSNSFNTVSHNNLTGKLRKCGWDK